jgi:SP family sugar:H+ symporter-like MFS transporter
LHLPGGTITNNYRPIAWVYQSEIFPLRVRAKGTGAATMSNWFANAFVSLVTPYVSNAIGFKMYIIFGCTGFAMASYTYFYVPETMGKNLEDMVFFKSLH